MMGCERGASNLTARLGAGLKTPERGCVVLDQPQQAPKFGAREESRRAAAGLRHSRAPFFKPAVREQTIRIAPHW